MTAEPHLTEAIQTFEGIAPGHAAGLRSDLALIRAEQGQFEVARSILKAVTEVLQDGEWSELYMLHLANRAVVEFLDGDDDAAYALLAEARSLLKESGYSSFSLPGDYLNWVERRIAPTALLT